ncbi:heavy-metal-associated domain-containing protein [Halobaculum sp. D14]|uniref:heavy-metal-associated domain-containing protein n=1 Tax=unclassified Halobaculum TaxID=2640896 RepID=UPI003EC11BF0
MSTTLTISGMTCGGCEDSVETALSEVDGVTSVSADHEADSATVEGDADPLDLVAAVPEPYEVESTQ